MSTVTVTAAGAALDSCLIGLPLEIVHGRGTIDTQPDAPTATFTWASDVPPAVLGDPVTIVDAVPFTVGTWADPGLSWADGSALWGGAPAADRSRFVGTIDQLQATEEGGAVVSWQVGCVGGQARLGHRLLPALFARPPESDVARVQNICAYSSTPVTIKGTPGVTVNSDPLNENRQDYLSALHDVCNSSAGLLWTDPAGNLTYGAADHRDTSGAQEIDCEVIGDGLAWAQTTDSIINQLSIAWGPQSARGETTYTATPPPNTRPWGLRTRKVDTMLNAEADAEQLGQLILRRHSEPFWGTPTVVVYCDDLDPQQRRAVADLDVSSAVVVPYPFTPGPVPTEGSLGTVEGWVETWDEAGHRMQLAVGDAARWVDTRLRTWAEAATEDWAYWKAGSWMDALIREPGDPV